MTTKSKKTKTTRTTKRKNPPDATHRNVRAAKALTVRVKVSLDKKLAAAFKKADRQMKTLADELFKALQRVDALEKRQKQLGQLGANVVERLEKIEDARSRLEERMYEIDHKPYFASPHELRDSTAPTAQPAKRKAVRS